MNIYDHTIEATHLFLLINKSAEWKCRAQNMLSFNSSKSYFVYEETKLSNSD